MPLSPQSPAAVSVVFLPRGPEKMKAPGGAVLHQCLEGKAEKVTDYRLFLFLILDICHSVCAIHACIVFGRVEKPSGKVET